MSTELRFPCRYIALARGFEAGKHNGIDMGWHSSQGGKYIPVCAPAAGEVVAAVDGCDNTYKQGKTWDYGNYVKIKHEDGLYTLMAHLKKGSVCVKVGDKVEAWEQVANMGNTGYSAGNHVHYEVFVGGSGASCKADPLKYTYAYTDEGDVVGPTTAKTYPIMYMEAGPEEPEEPEEPSQLVEVFASRKDGNAWKVVKIASAKPGDNIVVPEI